MRRARARRPAPLKPGHYPAVGHVLVWATYGALLEGVIVKLRTPTAFLLLGWYLMAPPPLSQDGRAHPLSDWTVVGAFRTEKECDAKLSRHSILAPDLDSYPDNLPPEEIYAKQCVATDDPRLAKGRRSTSAP